MKNLSVVILAVATFVLSACGGGGGSATNSSSTNTLSAPGAATVVAGDSALTLNWSAVSGATGYGVWYSQSNDSTSATRQGGDIAVTTYTLTGLTNSNTYYIWLTAMNSSGSSGFSPVASGVPSAPPPATLSSFAPTTSYIGVGQANAPTFPSPLTVTLSSAPSSDTFVSITSSDPSSISVVGGGVTVLAGQTSAQVLVNGIAQTGGATLTASLNSASLPATVRVLGATEQPVVASIAPVTPMIVRGETLPLTVTLDMPAPVGGAVVSLVLFPNGAGSIPATVIVPAGQLSASFDYADGSTTSSAAVSATLGGISATSNITITVPMGLVINEVDYDNVGTDTTEFVEILNTGATSISLSGIQLVLVNGATNAAYQTVDLGTVSSLAPGQYLIIGSDAVLATMPPGTPSISFGSGHDYIQNGPPDGLALINTNSNTIIDALSYEGSITFAAILGVGTVSLVEGNALPISTADSNIQGGSVCRHPNGTDTNNAATDWALCTTPTAGSANQP